MKYIGEIFMFGAQPPPAGCVEAGGQELDRVKYADLFRVYGVAYGDGDGSTTFNVPDIRGRVVAGPNTMGGGTASRLNGGSGGVSGATVGSTGGEESHTLTAIEVPPLQGPNVDSGNIEMGVTADDAQQPHNNVQPTIIIPFVIYTGVLG